MGESSQTPKSLKAQITRASLVLAAAALLREEGPGAVTYRRVAKWANAASSSVGYYFDSVTELLQEAGFHPLDVIQIATGNNAEILGWGDRLGRIRPGYLADLILIDENPLANLKYFYPTGVLDLKDGKPVRRGGVKWTIKDGLVYHTPTIMSEVKAMVDAARSKLK